MADLPEFVVNGERVPANQAFAPPDPWALPSLSTQVRTATPQGSALAAWFRNLAEFATRPLLFLIPQPTGPSEHDELDPEDVPFNAPPPPVTPPPAATDPIMPPNWNDLVEWPGTPTYVPITPVNIGEPVPVEMPPGEKYFDVSPPQPAPRPTIIEQPLPSPTWWELPYGNPDFGIGPRPGPAPAPTGTPRSDPATPTLWPDLEPGRSPQPDRTSPTAPDLFGAPLPDVVGNPFGDPFTPSPLPAPPGPKPRAPALPDFLAPTLAPDLKPEPTLPQFQPEKPVNADTCQCSKKKKDKKKKRKDREVCYRGTYVETKRGLSKKRIEEVPCEGAAKRSTGSKGAATKSKKLKPGQFPGLGFMGSENLTPSDWLDLAGSAVKEFAPIVKEILDRRKPKKQKKPKKGRKPKTKPGRVPGTVYTSPFPLEFGG